jgi:hypothetical protein
VRYARGGDALLNASFSFRKIVHDFSCTHAHKIEFEYRRGLISQR